MQTVHDKKCGVKCALITMMQWEVLIFRCVLDLTEFNFYVIRKKKHGGKYTYLQLWINIVQKSFQKYGGANPEAPLITARRTSHWGPAGRFTGRHFSWCEPSNRYKETCQQKMCDLYWKERKTQYTVAMIVMFPCINSVNIISIVACRTTSRQ